MFCSWAGPPGADSAWDNISRPQEETSEPLLATSKRSGKASWAVTIATLLSLQLGWGLWLMPSDYARCSKSLGSYVSVLCMEVHADMSWKDCIMLCLMHGDPTSQP